MMCLMVFDHLNDIVFSKIDEKFSQRLQKFAIEQGLIKAEQQASDDVNIFLQIFSPLITSQRIMNCQFGNSYTSFKCEDVNLCFDDYMGYMFVALGSENISDIKHFLRFCISTIIYLCGPDVCRIKNEETASTATKLINNWLKMIDNDQAIIVEAIEPLIVNPDLAATTVQVLHKSVEKLAGLVDCPKIHGMLLVKNKLLSLYSSPNAKELAQSDILFLTILSQSLLPFNDNSNGATEIRSLEILTASSETIPICLTHVVHIIRIVDGINLLYLLEVGNPTVSSSLFETFSNLHTLQLTQIQRDVETLRPAFENIDTSVKKLHDSLKKLKNSTVENCIKQLYKKWETIRKKYLDFLKNNSDESLLRAETLALGFLENLKELLQLTSVKTTLCESTQKQALQVAGIVAEKLSTFSDFLQVKAIRNFMAGSRSSLTITKYLEEFPGLVHFLYIDRTSHRITTPTLDYDSDETNKLTKQKIWSMIKFSRNHLQEGNLSLIWKDSIFSYAYFLWFEDNNGTILKPAVFPINSCKSLPLPGLLATDFYPKLKEVCFPKMSPKKIKCFELFCIHLGLVTATCVLEHVRRLAASVWELRGEFSNAPIDLL